MVTPPDSNPGTVLVIEDSAAIQQLMRLSLQPLGVSILTAPDRETGIELARKYLPDVILLDVGIPRLDGWGVIKELRSRVETAHIAVMVVTGYVGQDFAQIAERWGVDGMMTKPFRPSDLRVRIKTLLSQSQEPDE